MGLKAFGLLGGELCVSRIATQTKAEAADRSPYSQPQTLQLGLGLQSKACDSGVVVENPGLSNHRSDLCHH